MTAGSSTPADRRWNWASGSACRSGPLIGLRRRPSSSTGIRRPTESHWRLRSTGWPASAQAVAAEIDPESPSFGRAEVQLDGLERLWGPEPLIVERIADALAGSCPGGRRRGSPEPGLRPPRLRR